jgi:hypothetical protein
MVKYFLLILGLLAFCPEMSYSQGSQPTQTFTKKKPVTIESLTKDCEIVGILEQTDQIVYKTIRLNSERQPYNYYFVVELDLKKQCYKRVKVYMKDVSTSNK